MPGLLAALCGVTLFVLGLLGRADPYLAVPLGLGLALTALQVTFQPRVPYLTRGPRR